MLPVRGVRPQRRRQRAVRRLELGQAGDAVAVHVEREHALGADEPVVGLAAGREQDAGCARGRACSRGTPGARWGACPAVAGRPSGSGTSRRGRAPDAEHAEPALGEPAGRADAVLGRRARERHGRHGVRRSEREVVGDGLRDTAARAATGLAVRAFGGADRLAIFGQPPSSIAIVARASRPMSWMRGTAVRRRAGCRPGARSARRRSWTWGRTRWTRSPGSRCRPRGRTSSRGG